MLTPSSETNQPLVSRHGGTLLPITDKKDEPALPLPTDDEIPQETIQMLGHARDALFRLIQSVFTAAIEIVGALLRLIQSVAGRDVAEAVDAQVADALDPLVPDPAGPETPAAPAPTSEPEPTPEPTSEAEPASPAPARSEAADHDQLARGVETVFERFAATDAEREAITPALVELVTRGAQVLLAIERQFPGAIELLQSQEAPAETETPAAPSALEEPAPDATESCQAPPDRAGVLV